MPRKIFCASQRRCHVATLCDSLSKSFNTPTSCELTLVFFVCSNLQLFMHLNHWFSLQKYILSTTNWVDWPLRGLSYIESVNTYRSSDLCIGHRAGQFRKDTKWLFYLLFGGYPRLCTELGGPCSSQTWFHCGLAIPCSTRVTARALQLLTGWRYLK